MKRVFEDNGSLKLIFIRHGKPDYNDCGDRDISDGDLDATGIEQCQALDGNIGLAAGGAAHGQIAQLGDIDAKGIHEAGNFHDAVVGQVGNAAVVDNVEVTAVDTAGLHGFDDPAAVFLTALGRIVNSGGFLQPVGEVSLKPGPALSADPQIAAGLTVDPAAQIDPAVDFTGALPVPGDILRQVAVGLGGEVAKPLHHVDTDLFGLGDLGIGHEGLQQLAVELFAVMLDGNVPGHVVDTGTDDVDILLLIT